MAHQSASRIGSDHGDVESVSAMAVQLMVFWRSGTGADRGHAGREHVATSPSAALLNSIHHLIRANDAHGDIDFGFDSPPTSILGPDQPGKHSLEPSYSLPSPSSVAERLPLRLFLLLLALAFHST
jgi:hypothetical protein